MKIRPKFLDPTDLTILINDKKNIDYFDKGGSVYNYVLKRYGEKESNVLLKIRDYHFYTVAPDTVVKETSGKPIQVFHGGTSPNIRKFSLDTPNNASLTDTLDKRIYFSDSKGIARQYAVDPEYKLALTIDHLADAVGLDREGIEIIASRLKMPIKDGGSLKLQEGGIIETSVEEPIISVFRHLRNPELAKAIDLDLNSFLKRGELKDGLLSKNARRELQRKYNLDQTQVKETLEDLVNAGLGLALVADLIKEPEVIEFKNGGNLVQTFGIGGVGKVLDSSILKNISKRILQMGENSPEFSKFFGFKPLDNAITSLEKSGETVPLVAKYVQKKVSPEKLPNESLFLSGTTKKCSKATLKLLDTLAALGDLRCLVLSEILQNDLIELPAEFVSYVESIFKFGKVSNKRNSHLPFKLSAEEEQIYDKISPSRKTSMPKLIKYQLIYFNDKYYERPTDFIPNKKDIYKVKDDSYSLVKSFTTRSPKTLEEIFLINSDLDYAINKLQEIVNGNFNYTNKMLNSIMLKSTGKNLSYSGLKQMDSLARRNFGRLELPRILNDLMQFGHLPTNGVETIYDKATNDAVKVLQDLRDKWAKELDCLPEDLEIRPIMRKRNSTYVPIVDNRSTKTWGQLMKNPSKNVPLSHKIDRPDFVSDYAIFHKFGKTPLEIIPRKELHHALTPLAEAEMRAIVLDPTNRNGIRMINQIQKANKGTTAEDVINYYRSHLLLDQATHIAAHNDMILSKTDLGRIKNLAASGRFQDGDSLLKYYLGIKKQLLKFFASEGKVTS